MIIGLPPSRRGIPMSAGSIVGFEAHIAQSVEHFLGKEEVTGSNPVMGSRLFQVL